LNISSAHFISSNDESRKMDETEHSDLNQAHHETRKAERLVRQGLLDGAIECHEKAAAFLTTALSLTDLISVQQSLTCQKDHHLRQVWLLQSKIAQLDKLRKKKMNSTDEKRSIGTTSQETHADINSSIKVLQTDILRTLSETDSALQLHVDSCTSLDPNLNQVVECLRKMRNQLENLFDITSESDKEEDIHTDPTHPNFDRPRSPRSLSPSVDTGLNETESDLPVLAPLEVPKFDFSVKFD